VLAPKITGTRLLHKVFHDQDLEFFVMFGSAGSVIASPGQGNYAAANAFLDAFAHYRQAEGLPALTIGWGPWSVGMVEELKLEKIYAQRGLELITPAAGARILDRLISQKTPNVIAINADWARARSVGLGGRLPPMFCELGTAETSDDAADSQSSILDFLSGCPEADRANVVADRVREIVAAVFDLGVTDIGLDDALDDLGLDSLMAMDFRLRVNGMFAIDLPVLELLRGVSVSSLAVRILADLELDGASPSAVSDARSDSTGADDDVDRLIEQLSEADLRELLAELEAPATEQEAGGAQS
jgi:acyl carrier protein